jgi:hypothetical protein
MNRRRVEGFTENIMWKGWIVKRLGKGLVGEPK